MAKFVKVILNNWKKSTVGTVAVLYGINYAHDKYKIDQLMRAYCEEATKYGDIPVPPTLKPRHVTVILNPAANRRKAKSNYDKYCAPLLHLAGYTVDVIQTESEGQARVVAANLKDTDLIVVAGGDGTLSEIVTGLMRAQGIVRYPIGVLPLGRTNSVACTLLGRSKEGVGAPHEMAAAAMAVVRGQTKSLDALKVDVIEEGEDVPKPVYGLSGIKWGVFRDALSRQDSYWYLGVLRGYAAILFNTKHSESVRAHVMFTHACDGCNRCYQTRKDLHPSNSWRWYNYVIPSFTKKTPEIQQINYRQIVNSQCGLVSEINLSGQEIHISSPCVRHNTKGIEVSLGSTSESWTDYIEEGWRRVRGEPPSVTHKIDAQQLDIVPIMELKENEEKWFSIDNEDFEVRPIRVTLIPKSVRVYVPEQPKTSYTLLERILLGIS